MRHRFGEGDGSGGNGVCLTSHFCKDNGQDDDGVGEDEDVCVAEANGDSGEADSGANKCHHAGACKLQECMFKRRYMTRSASQTQNHTRVEQDKISLSHLTGKHKSV